MFGENKIFESIDNLFDIIDGDRGKNYPKSDELFSEEYCLFLNTKNVTKNGFSFDTKQFITKTKDKLLRKGKLERYDIVLTTRGTVGNVAYYDELIKYKHLRINSRFNEMFGDPLNNNKKFAVKTGQQCFKFSSGKFLDKHDRVFEGYPAYGGNGIAWKSRKYLIDNPTIIIGRVGAYCGNVRTTHGKVWISDNAIYIKEFKNSDFNLVFLLELMKVIDFSKFADFSGQPKITQKPLENQKYILPPLALKNEFADFVALVDKSQFACEIAIKVWRNSLKFSII